MAKALPPMTWLRSFEAAARHLSFTAAADEIGMTQSAVSQQIKALETRLGVPLFVRRARGLALTDQGRRLLPEIAAPLEALATVAQKFDTGPRTNLLTIATSVSVAQWVIAPNLPDFTAAFPDVRTRFLSATWPDDFQTSRADVEIRFGSSRQVGSDAELLLPNRLVPLKAPALDGPLDALPLIEAVGTSTGWRAWAEAIGGGVLQPSIYVDTYGMALQLAACGNGVALVDAWLAQHAIRSGQLEAAHQGSLPSKEGYFLSTAPDSLVASQFRTWLMARAELVDHAPMG